MKEIRRLSARKSETWRKDFPGFEYLLTPGEASTKTAKSNKFQQRFYNVIQYLAPATMAGGANLCPSHTPGCYGKKGENCIAGAGLLAMRNDILIARTRFFLQEPALYLERLLAEIDHFYRHAKKRGLELALRLNGTSDIAWERVAGYSELFGRYPDVVFYDYTKVLNRVLRDGKPVALPRNYHLTFSQSELNGEDVRQVILHTRVNVAKVFPFFPAIKGRREAEDLPKTWMGRRVIDGDKYDLRFPPFDPPGVIVGLRAKGELKKEVKKLRVLTGHEEMPTPAEVEKIEEEGKLTPGMAFTVKDPGIRTMRSVEEVAWFLQDAVDVQMANRFWAALWKALDTGAPMIVSRQAPHAVAGAKLVPYWGDPHRPAVRVYEAHTLGGAAFDFDIGEEAVAEFNAVVAAFPDRWTQVLWDAGPGQKPIARADVQRAIEASRR